MTDGLIPLSGSFMTYFKRIIFPSALISLCLYLNFDFFVVHAPQSGALLGILLIDAVLPILIWIGFVYRPMWVRMGSDRLHISDYGKAITVLLTEVDEVKTLVGSRGSSVIITFRNPTPLGKKIRFDPNAGCEDVARKIRRAISSANPSI